MDIFSYPDMIWLFTLLIYLTIGGICFLIYKRRNLRPVHANSQRKNKMNHNKNNEAQDTAKLLSKSNSKSIINNIWLKTISYFKREGFQNGGKGDNGLVKSSKRDLSHRRNNKKRPNKNFVYKKILEPTTSQVKIKEVELVTDDSKVNELDINMIAITNEQQVDFEQKIINTVETLTDDMSDFKLSDGNRTKENKETELVMIADHFKNTEQIKTMQKEKGKESKEKAYLPSQIVEEELDESFVCEEMLKLTTSHVKIKDIKLFVEDTRVLELATNVIATTREQEVGFEHRIISTDESLSDNLSDFKLNEEMYTEENKGTQLVMIADNFENTEQENGEASEEKDYFPPQIVVEELDESFVCEEMLKTTTSHVEINKIKLFVEDTSVRELATNLIATTREQEVGFEHRMISTAESLTDNSSDFKLNEEMYTEENKETQLVMIADNFENTEQENGEVSEEKDYFPSQIVVEELDESFVCEEMLKTTTSHVEINKIKLFVEDTSVRELATNLIATTREQEVSFEHRMISTDESLSDNLSDFKLNEEMYTEENKGTQLVMIADNFENTEQENGEASKEKDYFPPQIVVEELDESFVCEEMLKTTTSHVEINKIKLFVEDTSVRELATNLIATTREQEVGFEHRMISTDESLTDNSSDFKLNEEMYTEENKETQLVMIADNFENTEQENGEASEEKDYFPSQIVAEELDESFVREEMLEPTTSQEELKEADNSSVHELDINAIIVSSEEQISLVPKITSIIESITDELSDFKLSGEISTEEDKETQLVKIADHFKSTEQIEIIQKENGEQSDQKVYLPLQIVAEELDESFFCEETLVPIASKVARKEVHNLNVCKLDINAMTVPNIDQTGFEPEIINTTESESESELNAYDKPMPFDDIQFRTKKKKGRKKNRVRDSAELPSKLIEILNQTTEEDCDSVHSVGNSINAPNTVYSDIRSEGSQDSGRGESFFSGYQYTLSVFEMQTSYNFLVPIDLVGTIIGRRGTFVRFIQKKTHAKLTVRNEIEIPEDKFKMCTLVGSEINVNKALELIRIKFPDNPEITLEYFPPIMDPHVNDQYSYNMPRLIEGINNSVFIAKLINIDHFYVHNKSDSDFENLTNLNIAMNNTYRVGGELLDLSRIIYGSIVAAYSEGNWYRARVINVEGTKYEYANVFLLDYGGYKRIKQCDIRPINLLLMPLKFQAIKCGLANIAPLQGKWCSEALKLFKTLTAGKMMYAQVIYKTQHVDFINLLAIDNLGTFSINAELIKAGFAVHCYPSI